MDAIAKPPTDAALPQSLRAARRGGPRPSREEAEAAVRTLLAYLGDDPDREGLVETPQRVVRAYDELFRGYRAAPADAIERTFAEVGSYDDIVLVRDIAFTSHCEHHMMAFTGRAHVAYRPVGGVVGLSKLARLVEVFACRLQTQERLTDEIATALAALLRPRGVAVMLEAEHSCMALRGVRQAGARTVTTKFIGTFHADAAEQVRFMTMLRAPAR